MLLRTLSDCEQFLAGDHTVLRELLHPAKQAAWVGYSLAHGTLAPGRQSKRHRLTSSEVYYFIAGEGRFVLEGETRPVASGTMVSVPPGGEQFVENTGTVELEFLCIVDPAWKPDDEQILE